MITDLLKMSLEWIKDSKNNEIVKKAFRERLGKELIFNREILRELLKAEDEKNRAAFIGLLKTDIPRFLDGSMLSFEWFIGDVSLNIREATKKWEHAGEGYLKWSENISTLSHLLERIYTRIEITKSLATIGHIKRRSSHGYIEFLINVAQAQGF